MVLFAQVSSFFYYTLSLAITLKTPWYGVVSLGFFFVFDPINWYVLSYLFTELPDDMLYAKLWPSVCVIGGALVGNIQRLSIGNGPAFQISRNARQIRVSLLYFLKFVVHLIALWTYDFCTVNYDKYVGILVYGGVEVLSFLIINSSIYASAVYDSSRMEVQKFDEIYGVLEPRGLIQVFVIDVLNFIVQFGFLWMVYVSALIPDPLLWSILMMGTIHLVIGIGSFLIYRRVKRYASPILPTDTASQDEQKELLDDDHDDDDDDDGANDNNANNMTTRPPGSKAKGA
jgi:hypothetical protein